ncbi:MAG TPA: amidohydrolase [Gemmatimonadota bacterium]
MERGERGGEGKGERAFTGARVYTQDPTRPWAGGLIVRDGRVSRLLAEGESPPSGVPTLDLSGRLVLPGFVDAHTHLTLYARNLDRVALGGVPTLEEALARVREAAQRTADAVAVPDGGDWILGQGWDPHAWGGLPDGADLERAAPGRRIALESRDCHACWASAAALAAAGIGAGTPDPAGGRIVRDAAGEPTGILLEKATRLLTAVLPRGAEGESARLERALAEALSLGITGVHVLDAAEGMQKLETCDRSRGLPLRVVCYLAEKDLESALADGRRSGEQNGRVRLGGLKLFTDGALGSRTALLSEPYEGTSDFGIAIHDDAELADLARRAAVGGLAVAIHAIGDRANTRALDALETASAATPAARLPLPHRIEHAQLVFPADAERFGRAGIVASVQPCHIPGDWRPADRHWGDRCAFAYPFRTLLAGGATLALGSDVPVEGWNPFRNLYAAVARRDWDGQPSGGWHPAEALTLREAILACTVGSAVASGEADRRGRLTPGMDADFIALSGDLFELSPESWLELGSDLTVVGGQVVHAAESLDPSF